MLHSNRLVRVLMVVSGLALAGSVGAVERVERMPPAPPGPFLRAGVVLDSLSKRSGAEEAMKRDSVEGFRAEVDARRAAVTRNLAKIRSVSMRNPAFPATELFSRARTYHAERVMQPDCQPATRQ